MGDESIWKKEISFGRKRKDEGADADSGTGDGDEATSIWKKEISFGRKKNHDETSVPEPEVVADAPEEEPASEETWTRAVSFGRKSPPVEEPVVDEPATVVELPVAPAADAEPVHPASEEKAEPEETWTRAVSFGRKAEPEAVAEEPEPVADDVGMERHDFDSGSGSDPVTISEQSTAPEETWTRAVSFGRNAQPDPEPVAEDPEPVTEAEPVAADAGWTKEVSFSRAPAEPEPTIEPEPAPEPEPVAVTPVEVHPPVTADELEQLDEQEAKKVPFWKKEIGGKKKAPKAEAVAVATVAVATEDSEQEAEKVPFWKKEIGGKKKPMAERAPKEPKEPKAKKEKAPKERKPKQPKVKAARGSRGAKRITGLKVGASQLAAARVANNGSAELLQICRTAIEPGIVVGGELRDPDALAEALKEFFAANNLPKKGVRLGIANNRIGVRTFDIAGVGDEKQLQNAVRFRAQETLPIPIDEAVLDYQVLGEGTDDQGQPTKRILLVVAYRELIDRYVDACKKAGISLVGIDLEAFALLRALQPPQDGVGGDAAAALVAVAIGHDRSTFAVSDGRICEFTRVLEWGGSALNVAIARALDAAPSEVGGVKRALALTDEMVPEGLTEEQAKKARDAMRRAIQTFARELVSSLQYYQNQPGSLGIGEIVLTGGTAHLSGLAGELERLIGVRVRVGDPLARMKVSKKVGEAEQVGSLAVAIGLGIED
jgi:type IV pilus assembly protein PilM